MVRQMLRQVHEDRPRRLTARLLAAPVIVGVACFLLWRELGLLLTPIELPPEVARRPYYDAAFSPDGRLLALAEVGGAVSLWNLAARKETSLVASGADRNATSTVCFSNSGRLLAAAFAGEIVIWDVPTAKVKVRIPVARSGEPKFTEGDEELLALALPANLPPPDGLGDDLVVVRMDVPTGRVKSSTNLGFKIIGLVVSADGRCIAFRVGGSWGIYDLTTRAKVANVSGAQAVAFSGDGTVLVACEEGRLSVLHVPSGKELRRFEMNPPFMVGRPPKLSVSHDGRLLAAGSYPHAGSASLISLETGRVLGTVECGPGLAICRYVWLSPDGSILATEPSGVNLNDQPVEGEFRLWRVQGAR